MPLPTAHLAGLPLEETLLAAGPALLIWGGLVGLQVRQRLHRLRPARAGTDPAVPTSAAGRTDPRRPTAPSARARPTAARSSPLPADRHPPIPSNHRSPDRGLLR